jgi:hypothetical protein
MPYIDHRIVEGGEQRFALTDMRDIGKYVAKIISDPRTLNRHVFAYTEVLSMNEMWAVMANVSGEEPPKEFVSHVPREEPQGGRRKCEPHTPLRLQVSAAELQAIIESCRKRLEASPESLMHPSNIMDTANFNMGQYRISWCIRGDNTPEYADYLGYLDFWKLFPDFPRGKSLAEFYAEVIERPSGR